MNPLVQKIKACVICKDVLPFSPKPIVSFAANSRIFLVGQAPGTRVHETGIAWNDPSGERLRQWLDVDKKVFYDPRYFAIVPMGFCYPGKGKSGDLPPRPECAQTWMKPILAQVSKRHLTLLVGQYAQHFFLQKRGRKTLTLTVKNWQSYLPEYFVLPHPSPRNNIWLKKNPWFEKEVLVALKKRVHAILESDGR